MSPRTDLVSLYLPVTAYGHEVAEAEFTIRPTIDQGCPGNIDGIVADVSICDRNDKSHPLNDTDSKAILTRIRDEMPAVWREIEEQAEFNFKDGASPAVAA